MKGKTVALSIILIVLALVTGVFVTSRAVNSASRPPTITIQLFSQLLHLVLTRMNFTASCGSTFEIRMWNFTENMAGRDAGSTWIAFKASGGIGSIASLFKSHDVTPTVLSTLICGTPTPTPAVFDVWNKTQAVFVQSNGQGYLTWRPVISTSYTMLAFGGPLTPLPFRANETWTVTTVS